MMNNHCNNSNEIRVDVSNATIIIPPLFYINSSIKELWGIAQTHKKMTCAIKVSY